MAEGESVCMDCRTFACMDITICIDNWVNRKRVAGSGVALEVEERNGQAVKTS